MSNSAIPEIRMAGYNPIDLLDGTTRLRMAEANEPRTMAVPMTSSTAETAPLRSTRTEATAAAILIFGFTVLFWALLGYIRSH